MCELKTFSPRSKYDMVYLPWDVRRGSNISYSFVNFVDHESALRAFFALSGKSWNFVHTTKMCRLATAHIQGIAENLANYVVNFGIQDECQNAPNIFVDGKSVHLRLAVRLFCTSDMLERAAEAARTRKVDSEVASEVDSIDRRRKTSTEFAMEFKKSFQQFCESISQNHDDFVKTEHAVPDGAEALNPSDVKFWLRFRDSCLEFSSSLDTPSVFRFIGAVDPSQQIEDRVPMDFSRRRFNLNSMECFSGAHPARPKGKGKGYVGYTVPDVSLAATNALNQYAFGVEQTNRAALQESTRKDSFVDALRASLSVLVKPEEEVKPEAEFLPLPQLLMNGSRTNLLR